MSRLIREVMWYYHSVTPHLLIYIRNSAASVSDFFFFDKFESFSTYIFVSTELHSYRLNKHGNIICLHKWDTMKYISDEQNRLTNKISRYFTLETFVYTNNYRPVSRQNNGYMDGYIVYHNDEWLGLMHDYCCVWVIFCSFEWVEFRLFSLLQLEWSSTHALMKIWLSSLTATFFFIYVKFKLLSEFSHKSQAKRFLMLYVPCRRRRLSYNLKISQSFTIERAHTVSGKINKQIPMYR